MSQRECTVRDMGSGRGGSVIEAVKCSEMSVMSMNSTVTIATRRMNGASSRCG